MNGSPPEDFLQQQIRAHLDRQAAAVDVNRLWNRIQERLQTAEPPVISLPVRSGSGGGSFLRRKARWGVAAAAGVFLVILSTFSFTSPQASAETVLRQTTLAHQQPIDRHYQLEIRPDNRVQKLLPHVQPSRCQVWTRGDCFWVEMPGQNAPWQWGRDDQGRIWLALGPHLGLRFDADEIPTPLQEFLALRSADVPAILRDVLGSCELSDMTATTSQRIIHAKGKPTKHPFPVQEATLEIDPLRHELRSLKLYRGDAQGRRLGEVSLQLVDRPAQPEQHYQLEGHLTAPYRIYTRQQPLERMRRLMVLLQWSLQTHPRQ
jgi:hypothetical protein